MTAVQTPFSSQAGRYNFLGSMSLENAYVEIQGAGGKAQYVVLPTSGLVEFSDDADTPPRGAIFMDDLDCAYIVRENSVWKLTSNGTETRIGVIPGIDRVQITRNKKVTPQVTIRCDAGLYFIESDSVTLIIDDDLPDEVPVSVATLGEFTLLGYEDGRVFYSEQGETANYDALDFFTAEQSPDKLVRLLVTGGDLFIMSARTIENWDLAGASLDEPFVFRRLIQRGLLARDSVVEADGTFYWVADDKTHCVLAGYAAKRISNHETERLIRADTSASDILSFAWSEDGHSFIALKGTDWTRVYDSVTGEPHSRKSNGLDVWRVEFVFQAWGMNIAGDQESGNTYYFDPDIYTEDGATLIYKIRTPTMHIFPNGGIVDRITIDFLAGQGVTLATASGFDPLLMLRYSDDGGNTWSNARQLKMGKQGNTGTRIRTNRLGRFRDKGRVWELAVSDPVGRALAALDCKVRPLAA